jgi:hypothetical protein
MECRSNTLFRLIVYVALGAVPATYCSFLLVEAWPTYLAPQPYQSAAVHFYFACLPAIAVIASAALWLSALMTKAIPQRVRRLVIASLIAGLLVSLPWLMLFLPMPIIVIQTMIQPSNSIAAYHGAAPWTPLWILYGPFFIGIHAIVLMTRGIGRETGQVEL